MIEQDVELANKAAKKILARSDFIFLANVKIADAGMEVQNHLGLRRRSAHRLVGRGGAARFGKV